MALREQPQCRVTLWAEMVVCKAQDIEPRLFQEVIKLLPYLLWIRFRYPL